MALADWWEANFDWLDPEHATATGLIVDGLLLALLTLAVAYVVAYLWHRYRDQKPAE